jgi:hypothetical protein
MVIHNFNIIGIAVFPFKTNAPLPIYADAALPGAVPAQCLKPVAGQGHKVLDGFCIVQNFQTPLSLGGKSSELPDTLPVEKRFGLFATESFYH